ncbi:MAG: hypothetical protein PHW62_04215, partial [Candidatus Ratteibacteria bacterium]|nr:hypothetical protein [Candidatus Ratteibacteria bacterium]
MKKSVAKAAKSHIRSFFKIALQGKNKFLIIGGISLLCLLLIVNGFIQGRKKIGELITYEVKREDLVISVIEGGNLKALRFQRIINEVPG